MKAEVKVVEEVGDFEEVVDQLGFVFFPGTKYYTQQLYQTNYPQKAADLLKLIEVEMFPNVIKQCYELTGTLPTKLEVEATLRVNPERGKPALILVVQLPELMRVGGQNQGQGRQVKFKRKSGRG
jgi:hypothetical protein